jgi:hypothetical protein
MENKIGLDSLEQATAVQSPKFSSEENIINLKYLRNKFEIFFSALHMFSTSSLPKLARCYHALAAICRIFIFGFALNNQIFTKNIK